MNKRFANDVGPSWRKSWGVHAEDGVVEQLAREWPVSLALIAWSACFMVGLLWGAVVAEVL